VAIQDHRSDGRFRFKYRPDEPRDCPRCERNLEATQFHAKTRFEDGSVRTRQTLCIDCARERQRELGGHKPKSAMSKGERKRRRRELYAEKMADPERAERQRIAKREQARRRRALAKTDPEVDAAIRAATKRHYDRIRSDPEAWQAKLTDQRIRYRGEGDPISLHSDANGGWQPGAHLEAIVPADPFLAYLGEAFPDATPEQLEELTGIPSRRFREFTYGKAVVSLDLVDRALTIGLGRPDLVAALYPYDGGSQ
jgi:hypothetical protein